MKKGNAPKKTRWSLAGEVKAERNLIGKINAASGRNMFWGSALGIPKTDRELFGFIARVRELDPRKAEPKEWGKQMTQLGFKVWLAILENEHSFFYGVGKVLQYKQAPGDHAYQLRYRDILEFCFHYSCGMEGEQPCDGKALADYMKQRGHKFSGDYDNQVPRVLRETCEKIGVSVSKKPIGRPRIKSRR